MGLGAALVKDEDNAAAEAAFAKAVAAIEALRRGGRTGEAALTEAFHHAVRGRDEAAVTCLQTLLDRAEMPFTCWTIPVEPLFQPIRARPLFQPVLSKLALRAR